MKKSRESLGMSKFVRLNPYFQFLKFSKVSTWAAQLTRHMTTRRCFFVFLFCVMELRIRVCDRAFVFERLTKTSTISKNDSKINEHQHRTWSPSNDNLCSEKTKGRFKTEIINSRSSWKNNCFRFFLVFNPPRNGQSPRGSWTINKTHHFQKNKNKKAIKSCSHVLWIAKNYAKITPKPESPQVHFFAYPNILLRRLYIHG